MTGIYGDLALPVPKSRGEVNAIQSERKVLAVERARQSKFWADKLKDIDTTKLDDPEEWAKIPILDKDQLRAMSAEEFYRDFCIGGFADVCALSSPFFFSYPIVPRTRK